VVFLLCVLVLLAPAVVAGMLVVGAEITLLRLTPFWEQRVSAILSMAC